MFSYRQIVSHYFYKSVQMLSGLNISYNVGDNLTFLKPLNTIKKRRNNSDISECYELESCYECKQIIIQGDMIKKVQYNSLIRQKSPIENFTQDDTSIFIKKFKSKLCNYSSNVNFKNNTVYSFQNKICTCKKYNVDKNQMLKNQNISQICITCNNSYSCRLCAREQNIENKPFSYIN